MNNYSCKYDGVEVEDYCCIRHFLEAVIEEVFDTDDEYSSTTIVAKGDLAQDLIRLLLSMQIDDEDDGNFLFHMCMVDFDSIEYDKEYYISINNDFEVWCEPAYHDGIYYTDEADITYVGEDSDYKILDYVESDDITIFGFGDEE